MARAVSKKTILKRALKYLNPEEAAQCKALLDKLDENVVTAAALGPFANLVVSRGYKVRKTLSEKTGINFRNFNIVDRSGRFLNLNTALGGGKVLSRVEFNPYQERLGMFQGTMTARAPRAGRKKIPKHLINGEYYFNASDGKFHGIFEINTYLDASRFRQVRGIRRGSKYGEPTIVFKNGKKTWGAYILGKFYPGIYSQPVKEGVSTRTLVLYDNHPQSYYLPSKYVFLSNVGNKKDYMGHFLRPFINCEFVVDMAVESAKSYKIGEFKKKVIKSVRYWFAQHDLDWYERDKVDARREKYK